MVRNTNSSVEYTGNREGELDGRDVGDFVLTLGETGQRIVLEAKTEYYSKNKIQVEMEDAIQNRDADYGMFVTDTLENIPETKLGWFQELDQEYVSVVLSENEDDDLEPGYLRIAFNWARMRAIQSYAEIGEEFDPERLQSEVGEIEDAIDRFSTIRGHCTEIKKSKDSIEDELETIEREVNSRISEISAELNKASTE